MVLPVVTEEVPAKSQLKRLLERAVTVAVVTAEGFTQQAVARLHRDRGRRRRYSTEAVPGEVVEGRGEGRGHRGPVGCRSRTITVTGDAAATGRRLSEAGDC